MKSKILGLLAVALLAGPIAANAVVIAVSGSGVAGVDGQWDVTYTSGTGDSLLSLLDDQVWFGNTALAQLFANTLGAGLGFPNNAGLRGPHFLAVTDGSLLPGQDPFQGYRAWSGGVFAFQVTGSSVWAWATATRVPEPGTLAMLGLGLLGLGVTRRRTN